MSYGISFTTNSYAHIKVKYTIFKDFGLNKYMSHVIPALESNVTPVLPCFKDFTFLRQLQLQSMLCYAILMPLARPHRDKMWIAIYTYQLFDLKIEKFIGNCPIIYQKLHIYINIMYCIVSANISTRLNKRIVVYDLVQDIISPHKSYQQLISI